MVEVRENQSTAQVAQEKQLIQNVPPRQQIQACIDSLRFLQKFKDNGNESEPDRFQDKLASVISIFKKVKHNAKFSDNPDVATRLIKITVGIFDNTLVNEIADRESGNNDQSNGCSKYYRSDGERFNRLYRDFYHFRTCYFKSAISSRGSRDISIMTSRERGKLQRSNKSRIEAKNIANLHYSDDTLDLDEIVNIGYEQFHFAPFQINEEIGGIVYNLDMNKADMMLHSKSEFPRQEIWTAMLGKGQLIFSPNHEQEGEEPPKEKSLKPKRSLVNRSGISLFARRKHEASIVDESKDEYDDMNEEINYAWNEIVREFPGKDRGSRFMARKSTVWIRAGDQTTSIKDFLRKHKEHYSHVLGRAHPVYGQEILELTRSGVSANEAAILTIANLSGKKKQERPKAYKMPGWYYENNSSVDMYFETAQNDSDARVFFINYEPNNPGTYFLHGYANAREEQITRIKERANSDPKNKYFLTVDKTSNLLYESFAVGENMPENLSIFETASMTKHQRGGRNYFYGLVSYWGDHKTASLISDAVLLSRGELTPLGIIHYPRLTRSEISKYMERVKNLGQIIKSAFELVQKDVEPEKRWRFDAYNQFGFVVPPFSYLLNQCKYLNGDALKDDELANFMVENGIDGDEVLKLLNRFAKHTDNFEIGDSFGLTRTRLNIFGDQKKPLTNLVRISPGLSTPTEELQDISNNLISELAIRTKSLRKTRYDYVNFEPAW